MDKRKWLLEKYFVENSLENPGAFTIKNIGGVYLPRDKAKEVIVSLQKFYDNITDQEIVQNNNNIFDEFESAQVSDIKSDGYVYIIKKAGLYKIGASRNPKKRIKSFAKTPPFNIETIHIIYSKDMYAFEGRLHRMFSDKNIKGEWYSLDIEDLEEINEIRGSHE